MSKPVIWLLGAHGQLGHALTGALRQLGEVSTLTRIEADLSEPTTLRQALLKRAQTGVPDLIVNAAAYTAVDKAQTEPALAHAVNAESPGVLAELAQTWGAILVHYSTDYVFDGTGVKPWCEADTPHPLSVYGTSKREGEVRIAQTCPKYLILRTSWVVGVDGQNFLKTMLRLAAERDSLRVVADQVGVPTSTALLSEVTVTLIRAMQDANATDPRWGTYHVAAAGETSWHGYAQYVIAGAIDRGAVLKASPRAIQPIATSEYPLPAPRPANSRLDTGKFQKTWGIALPAWQVGVDAILDQLIGKKSP